MNHKPVLIAVVLLALLVAPPAAAQATDQPTNSTATPTATPQPEDNSTAILALDGRTDVVEKSYNRNTGVLTLTFESQRYAPVQLLVIEDTDASTGSASFQTANLNPGERTEVQIEAPPNSRVWISTDLSRENGELHFVKTTEGSALLSGPWSGADVRDAGAASAAGVALMVLYRLVLERSAVNKDGERVA
ncbi:hypothetical protein [Halobellus rufus]|uniref:hypothetical protein n=1 Tax=Halobellus rufus TaxID=1448860 RepID=UPI0012E04DE8|nr:hypothetical protein [Halobellus rufus]